MAQGPAYIVKREDIDRDPELKEKGARKLIVTELYPSKERFTTNLHFAPPDLGPAPVSLSQNENLAGIYVSGSQRIEMAVFTHEARQDRHYHLEGTEIYTVLEGQMRIEVEGNDYELSAGDSITIHPGAVHMVQARKVPFRTQVITCNCGGLKDKFVVPSEGSKTRFYEIKNQNKSSKRVVVVGMAAIDVISKSKAPLVPEDSNIGNINTSFGGVARNTAECLARLKSNVSLHTVIGDDYFGKILLDNCASLGIDISFVRKLKGSKTAVFNAIMNSNGEEFVSVNDMGIFEAMEKDPKELQGFLEGLRKDLQGASFCFVDSNLTPSLLKQVITLSKEHNVPVWFDSTSLAKASRIVEAGVLALLDYLKPNESEAILLAKMIDPNLAANSDCTLAEAGEALAKVVPTVIVTQGANGVTVFQKGSKTLEFSALTPSAIVNVTGAGDAFNGGAISRLALGGTFEGAVRLGLESAKLTVESAETISPLIETLKDL